MVIKLDIPFSEKDEVKKLGARWLVDKKSWIIPESFYNINRFQKWLPKQEGYLLKQPLIISKSTKPCWKCSKDTLQVAIGTKAYYESEYIEDNIFEWRRSTSFILLSTITFMPKELSENLVIRFPFFKYTYSKTVGEKYWGNTCQYCGVLQGDFFNFNEPGGAFFPTTEYEAKKIQLERLSLDFACFVQASPVLCTAYQLLIMNSKKNATISNHQYSTSAHQKSFFRQAINDIIRLLKK